MSEEPETPGLETPEDTSPSDAPAADVEAESPAAAEAESPTAAAAEAVEPEAAEAAEEAPSPAVKGQEAEEAAAEETPAEVAEEPVAEAEAPVKPRRRRRGAKADESAAAPEPAAGKPAKPAPSRRRVAREPGVAPPIVRAQAKFVRSSPRKARLVCDHIRGKSVEEARAILAHTPRAVARDWSKLLESAVANAEHNHELVGEDLYVKAVMADEGPTIKRFRPRAMGRATKIRKRTTHLTILLTPKE
jgi:ribosomal protein L22